MFGSLWGLIGLLFLCALIIVPYNYKVSIDLNNDKIIFDITLTPLSIRYNRVDNVATQLVGSYTLIKENYKDGGCRLILLR
jgi:hypothetical protein